MAGNRRRSSSEQYRTAPFPEIFTWSEALDFSRDGRKIAVLIERRESALETELWVVPHPVGTPRRVLDRVPYGFDSPRVSWAADNRHLVLAGSDVGSARRSLYLVDTERASIQPITSGVMDAVAPSISPEGDRIAFAPGSDDADVVQFGLDGSELRTLLASARDERDPSWSPDGHQIAYATNARGTPEIWLRSLREGWSRPIVTKDSLAAGAWQNLGKPVFSPDGQRVAFEVIGATHAIWVSSVAGGSSVLLDRESTDQHSPSWSPDGQWLAYERLNGVTWELVKVPVGGGPPVALADANAGGAPQLAWSPAGEWIAQTRGSTLRVVSAEGATVKELGSGSSAFGFSRDGSVLHALRRAPSGEWEIASVVVATGVERGAIPRNLPRDATVSGFSLHPDGNNVATSVAIARYDIWILKGFAPPTSWFAGRFWKR